ALGRNRTRDPRVPEPKRTPLGYILYIIILLSIEFQHQTFFALQE
ncbi:unnamed protein product, partial [Tenebrio molitor]